MSRLLLMFEIKRHNMKQFVQISRVHFWESVQRRGINHTSKNLNKINKS